MTDKDGCLRQQIECGAAGFQFDLGANAAPTAGAIAGCRGAYDEEGCFRQGLSTAAAAVEAALGAAPTAAEIADEIAGEAYEAAHERLRGDFAKKLGTMAARVAKARPQALRLAAPALTGCKAAKVVQTCVRTAIEAAADRVEASLTAR